MNILRQGVSILKRAFPLGKRAWPERKRAWPENFSGGLAPGPPINPVTKLPGSAPVLCVLPQDSSNALIFFAVKSPGAFTLLYFQINQGFCSYVFLRLLFSRLESFFTLVSLPNPSLNVHLPYLHFFQAGIDDMIKSF